MSTRLIPEVLVVDPLDRGLEQVLSACGMRTTRGSAAEIDRQLASLTGRRALRESERMAVAAAQP